MDKILSHKEAGRSFEDGPYRRMERMADGRLVEIPSLVWDAYEWMDVTSNTDPMDIHIFIRMRPLDS